MCPYVQCISSVILIGVFGVLDHQGQTGHQKIDGTKYTGHLQHNWIPQANQHQRHTGYQGHTRYIEQTGHQEYL